MPRRRKTNTNKRFSNAHAGGGDRVDGSAGKDAGNGAGNGLTGLQAMVYNKLSP